MVVFRYDGSFEGLLTAVFDLYFRKTVPGLLLKAGDPVPLFADDPHEVITDRVKSGRVWSGLEQKVPKNVCNMILHVWLSDEPQNDLLLMTFIRKIFDSKYDVWRDFADPDVLRMIKTAKKVSKERHYMMQFVRFQKAADGTFFSPVSPDHNVLPLIVDFFLDRFADQKWLIYDTKRDYGLFYDLQKVTEMVLPPGTVTIDGQLDESLLDKDEKLYQIMWKSYFKSITIQERKNLKLHRQQMPRRFWKYLTEKQ